MDEGISAWKGLVTVSEAIDGEEVGDIGEVGVEAWAQLPRDATGLSNGDLPKAGDGAFRLEGTGLRKMSALVRPHLFLSMYVS